MIELLRKLEPRTEPSGTILYKTIEEVEEMFFIEQGTVDIGFEINRETKFVMRLKRGGVIGAFNMTAHCKTLFVYQVKQTYSGTTIRKEAWDELMNNEEYEDITSYIKIKVELEYNNKIKKPMIIEQKKYISKLKMRKDQVQVLSLINLETEAPELKIAEKQYMKAISKDPWQ
jgi:hypothetical protein